MRNLGTVWMAVPLLFAGSVLAEDPPTAPGGSTFQISETSVFNSSHDDQGPKVETDALGNFVVVWGTSTQGEYTYPYGYQYDANVFLRRFNASAVAQGAEAVVVISATDGLLNPAAAMDSDGDFVVVWDRSSTGGYPYLTGVEAQRYDENGDAAGSMLPVTGFAGGVRRHPNVAMAPAGNFTVVWESSINAYNDFDGIAQRYDNAGVAQGTIFSVSSDLGNSNGLRDNPAIGMDAEGNFVVVWHKQDYGNYTEKTILGRRFASNGVAAGDEFEIGAARSSFSPQFTNALEVASDSSGNFAVVWEDYDSSAYVTRVMARHYDNTGAAQGAAFQVNTSKESYGSPINEQRPEVVWDTEGGFVIVWDTNYQVFGRRYEPGEAAGAEFRVDQPVSPYFMGAKIPSVAAMPDGEFVVTWQGPGGDYGANHVLGRTVPEPREWVGYLVALTTLMLLSARSLRNPTPHPHRWTAR
jgi:hypothetical protein